ncbi:MAG: hypothetical protein ABF289_14990 [Clostridiales bacterium]
MTYKKILKLVGLNLGISSYNIILFSPAFIGIELGASALLTAFGGSSIFLSTAFFVYGNYKVLIKEEDQELLPLVTDEDYKYLLEQNIQKTTFKKDIDIVLNQIDRMKNKKKTILDVLLEKFSQTELSYIKFESAILEVEKVFFSNVKSIINKLSIFDESEFEILIENKKNFSENFMKSKTDLYNKYKNFLKKSVEDNEEIILKLDKLLLEISRLNTLESIEIDNLSAIKEIDKLSNQIKYYK